nr:hypothetical protein [Rickettsia tillamookensis]
MFLDTVVKPRYDKVDSCFRRNDIEHLLLFPIFSSGILKM